MRSLRTVIQGTSLWQIQCKLVLRSSRPGNYKAEWNGPANDVKVDIVQNGKTVATTEGKIKDLQQPAPYDAVMIKTLQNNTKALDEIDFNHRSEALVLEGE